ncbi:zinc ribbon domain-containing protein [Paenibacillus caui]|uniref:zinc ribbon domain-containing protein n=1 Tax=Paenibacillus caui TaxID=2873927 RepID=UPI001CA874F9|nr:zinc ribbon domain-containing protein [Paenibacillus caui]
MGFLDRIKSGANKASERAQSVMEINKLNTQISNIEREMGIYYQRMGQVFYEGYRAKDMTQAEKEMMELAKTCDLLAEERDEIRARIAALKNERLCECGKVVPQEAIFCPYCGNKLKARSSGTYSSASKGREEEEAGSETAVSTETMVYRGPLIKEKPQEEKHLSSEEEERRRRELERERERQEELDRRIRTWKESMSSHSSGSEQSHTSETEFKCQICAAPLAKGTKWCPHCGAEQI